MHNFNLTALCKEDPNANVPLGKSCERYWACQGGYPRLQRCPATLVFDKQSRRCVTPPTVDCDVPSTTPPPEEEVGGNQGFISSNPARGGGGARPSRPRQPQVQQRQPQLPPRQPIISQTNDFRGSILEQEPLPIQTGNTIGGLARPPPIKNAIPLN